MNILGCVVVPYHRRRTEQIEKKLSKSTNLITLGLSNINVLFCQRIFIGYLSYYSEKYLQSPFFWGWRCF